jgi:hypothetical protein
MKQAPTQALNTADLDKRITKLEWRMKKEALVGRRRAALEARHGGGLSVNRLLIPCIIRPDACIEPPNPCSFDDASPDNPARGVDLQGWRACSARLRFSPIRVAAAGIAAILRDAARRSALADLRIKIADLG